MSKAYLLVICLLFTSLTGCLTDDEPEDKSPTTKDDEIVEEDDTIEPVGQAGHNNTSSNDTYYYENNETYIYNYYVEDSSYDPEHFSSVWISNEVEGDWTIVNGTRYWVDNPDENDFDTTTNFRGWFNKTGNNVHITPTYIENLIAPDYWHKITIYGPDGLYWEDNVIFYRVIYSDIAYYHINEIDIELPWEPVGFTLQWTGHNSLISSGVMDAYYPTTRAF